MGYNQLLVCTDNVNLMGKNIHTAKEGGGRGCKKGGLEINAAETKYIFKFHKQNAGQNYKLGGIRSFKSVAQLKYLETT